MLATLCNRKNDLVIFNKSKRNEVIMSTKKLVLGQFSIGIGDRFGMEGRAQLRALKQALEKGVEITPVWNKSNREHTLIGTEPISTRAAAAAAVQAEGWTRPFFVDADHIGMKPVDRFIDACDFFTLDVADYIGKAAPAEEIERFIAAITPHIGVVRHPGLDHDLKISGEALHAFSQKYVYAIQEAAKTYAYIKQKKGEGNFVAEVSVDEAYDPQTPAELYLFLAGLAHVGIAASTVAPKFSGAFLKGIDYVGDVNGFAKEFKDDLAVIAIAKDKFGLPQELKLSVHSGSDKYSLYPHIYSIIKKNGGGVHLKTAGTTWLEEVIGLASDTSTLPIAKKIYALAFDRFEELRKPYETVVEIEQSKLPAPSVVNAWTSEQYVAALKHDQGSKTLDKNFRQLVHIAFRIAAEMGDEFKNGLVQARESIEHNVTYNLYNRHIEPLFLGKK